MTCYDAFEKPASAAGGNMRIPMFTIQQLSILLLAMMIAFGMIAGAGAQSQEPKPDLPATPIPETSATTGVSGSSWLGPNWGVSISWDPAEWVVEDEFITEGYDGLRIGTPISTVYVEAYDGFGGDAEACLLDAESELSEREGVTEVVPMTDRPMPVADQDRGPARFYGLTATMEDGTPFRGVEYIECRTIEPGIAVLEITWQTATGGFNEDFPRVESLLASIAIAEPPVPAATPTALLATPVA
jgi:hypothetical protein